MKIYAICCLLCLTAVNANGQNENSQPDFFSPNTKFQVVFNGGVGIVCEGPAMSPDGLIYFADVTVDKIAGIIWSFNPQTKKTTVFRSPSGGAAGLVFDSKGNLIVAEGANFGGRRVTKTDMKTGIATILADTFRGKVFNDPNDVTLDMQGRIYFTDSRYLSKDPIDQPLMGVYGIDLDDSTHLIAANATRPNGIAISPNQKSLYIANYDFPGTGIYGTLPDGFSGPVTKTTGDILEYELLPDGNLKFKKELVHFENEGPDGIKVDKEGNLYVIVSNRLAVYSPQGKKLAELKIPIKEGFAANLCFGIGKYSKTLFITATKTLYMIECIKEGFHISFMQSK